MKNMNNTNFLVTALLCALTFAPHSLCAQEAPAGENADRVDLAKKLSNPVADLISVLLRNNWDFGINSAQTTRYIFTVEPVIPVSLNNEWNLIIRTEAPFTSVVSRSAGGSSASGIGDIFQSFFFSRKERAPGELTWGAGPVILYPSASDVAFGGGKWGAGPTAAALQQENGWTYGAVANHVWSFAGQSNRPAISSTFLQPFVSYTAGTLTTIGLNTETTHDWINSQWTVPLNLTFAQLMNFGSQPFQLTLGGRYYVEKQTGGPNWGLRLDAALVFQH
jgi:hypothetical protein